MKPLAVQLYSLRDQKLEWEWKPDLDRPVLERLASIGYLGVETVDIPGGDPVAARRALAEIGLQVTSSHTWADPADAEAFDRACGRIAELGSRRVMTFGGHPASVDDVSAVADRLNGAAAVARRHGLRLALHNEVTEAKTLDGRRIYQRFADLLDPDVDFQVDIFWATAGRVHPATMIRDLAGRVVSLHVKDSDQLPESTEEVFASDEFVNVPVGQGSIDVRGAIEAANEQAGIEWLIVEFDYCATDILDAVETSYRYLVSNGLGRGGH